MLLGYNTNGLQNHRLPDALRHKLAQRVDTAGIDWTRTRAFCLPTDLEGHIRINTMFASAGTRKAVHEGRADVGFLSRPRTEAERDYEENRTGPLASNGVAAGAFERLCPDAPAPRRTGFSVCCISTQTRPKRDCLTCPRSGIAPNLWRGGKQFARDGTRKWRPADEPSRTRND